MSENNTGSGSDWVDPDDALERTEKCSPRPRWRLATR